MQTYVIFYLIDLGFRGVDILSKKMDMSKWVLPFLSLSKRVYSIRNNLLPLGLNPFLVE